MLFSSHRPPNYAYHHQLGEWKSGDCTDSWAENDYLYLPKSLSEPHNNHLKYQTLCEHQTSAQYQGQISGPEFFSGLSTDNTSSSTKREGDGTWWQEVRKRQGQWETEHIKTQIRLASLCWPSARVFVCICGCMDVSACGKHVNLCMCPGACVSVCVHRGGCARMLILTCLLQTEWEDGKKKTENWAQDG